MYLVGYSIDNLSLMALAISTGFVGDDAIVGIEDITRYMEQGMKPVAAAFRGAREIGFTVLSMSTSLIAVFIPILLMQGIVGRLFREFAVTLSTAIAMSLLISLTATPMMCAKFLRPPDEQKHGRIFHASERSFDFILRMYRGSLGWVLRHQFVTLAITVMTAGLSVYLYIIVPKGFFPQQDSGRMGGGVQAEQDISFPALKAKITQFVDIVKSDPDVDTVVGFVGGGGGGGGGRMFVTLKPIGVRKVSVDQVIARLRPKLVLPGATIFLQATQDLQIGGRQSNAQFQYTLQSENLDDLNTWAPRLLNKLRAEPALRDVNSDQQDKGLSEQVVVDRVTAARLGITSAQVDRVLYTYFGQAQVSTMYRQFNQYHVVLEADPRLRQGPTALATVYIVLGILYESYIHPITILSTLPSAGVGAILALLLTHNDLNIIAVIGIILLIGIVKKNAILMIDFAIQAERQQNKSPEEAIYQSCLLRFRPIMMTTMAAMLGGLPLALGRGTGAELRRPLGIAIVGGLIVSQT